MKKINLHDIFVGLQKGMINTLSTNQIVINHPGIKGDASELCWKDLMNDYLPRRYQADKAIVVDSLGQLSDQIDIVVFDRQYSPFLFNQEETLYVSAESAYAIFEVKTTINKYTIEYAGEKAKSVRCLKRTSVPIPYVEGKYCAKEPFEIIAGLLALNNKWNPPYGDSFRETVVNLPIESRLQLGCALCSGAFNIEFTNNDKAPPIEVCEAEESLIFFFLRLLIRLQQIGTVTAMDIAQYAKAIKFRYI